MKMRIGINMNKKDLILTCVYNKCDIAEQEYENYLQNLRYSSPDEVDILEHLIRKIRRDTLRELLRDIMHILSLTKGK